LDLAFAKRKIACAGLAFPPRKRFVFLSKLAYIEGNDNKKDGAFVSLSKERITFEQDGATYVLHTSRLTNAVGPLPAILVIQEIWGVNGHILDVTDRIAQAGYLAVAPDLYAEAGVRNELLENSRVDKVRTFLRSGPNLFADAEAREEALAKLPAEERKELKETADKLLGGRRIPEFAETVHAAFRFLRNYEGCRGQAVASIGFCMGGGLSAMLANAEPDLAGAVVYYGRLQADHASGISCPVLGFFGSLDPGVTSTVPSFAEAMDNSSKEFHYEIYDGAPHAFFNDTGPGYNVTASRDAWAQTLTFFNRVTAPQ
jgi:carboxymethylenebutenolidase